jgi:PAS domain S-box-containing protein
MDLNGLSSILGLLGGGGAIGFILTYLSRMRKSSLDELRDVIKDRKEEIDRLRRLEADNNERIKNLEAKINNMESKIMLMESAHHDLPLPQWLKDLNGTMLSINAEYERVFLAPHGLKMDQYIGKNDSMVWGEETAKHWRKIDTDVQRNRKHIFSVENVPNPDGTEITWEILKYPRYAGNVIIGVGGIALRPLNK